MSCEKRGRSNFYGVVITRDEYIQYEADIVYTKVFGSNMELLYKTLIEAKSVSKEEINAAAKNL